MQVLGVDPGYDRLGIAVLEKKSGKETLLYSACFETGRDQAFPDRLVAVGTELRRIIEMWRPELLAIETLYMSKNQKTALPVASARGVVLFIAAEQKLLIREYSPQAIKIATTGYGNASKEQIIRMIPRLIALEKPIKRDDEYDAIAAALTALATEKGL